MSFENIKGHKTNIEWLKKMVDTNEIPSSILFYGKDGIGKFLVAKEFAKSVLCKNKFEEMDAFFSLASSVPCCNNCDSCRMFDSYVHPDFLLVDFNFQANLLGEKLNEQKNLKIETLREAIKFANLKPSFGKRKVIIINDADKMTVDAQNSVLKTLEEPYPGTLLILVSSFHNMLLSTILSRCFKIHFNKLDQSSVMDVLIEKGYEFKRAELLSGISEGSVSNAIKYEWVLNLFGEYKNYKELAPFMIVSKISKSPDFREISLTILNFINSFLYSKISEYDRNRVVEFIKENSKYIDYLKHNVNTKVVLSIALYKFISDFNFLEQGVKI